MSPRGGAERRPDVRFALRAPLTLTCRTNMRGARGRDGSGTADASCPTKLCDSLNAVADLVD